MADSAEQFVHLPNGVSICYQTFGSSSDPAILLLAGGGQSMLAWNEDFIRLLSPPSNPHFIIRYDIRDTGRSTCYPVSADGKSPYTLTDLADDALAILDQLNIKAAHLVGFSLGGGIAYTIAGQKAPHLVKSLSLLSTTPIGPSPRPEDGIPGLAPDLAAKLRAAPIPSDWHARDQVIAFLCYFNSCMAYIPLTSAEEAEAAVLASKVFDRAEANETTVQTFFNQQGMAHSPWPREALRNVSCPTVIVHGRHDQNLPLLHAELLQEGILGSKLVVIEDMAHELPRRAWEVITREILEVSRD
jgi:pimeloyl-ACP methyl ester carboxylesterase